MGLASDATISHLQTAGVRLRGAELRRHVGQSHLAAKLTDLFDRAVAELGQVVRFAARDAMIANRVLRVLLTTAPRQVRQHVVGSIVVQVAGFSAGEGRRPLKREQH